MSVNVNTLLALLDTLHSHRVYCPDFIAESLRKAGFAAEVIEDRSGVLVGDEVLPLVEPEWGDPGVSSISVLALACQLLIGHLPDSSMIGRGFWYRDVLRQLKTEIESN